MSQKKVHVVQHKASHKQMDARIRRTREALGDALVQLMQEKSFESITVDDILKRAEVSRSTFYKHFTGKEDLFMSDADEFFEMISTALSRHGDKSNRVFPVKEFFEHVRQMRQFFRALVTSGKVYENLELGRGHFTRGIERRLAEIPAANVFRPNSVQQSLLRTREH